MAPRQFTAALVAVLFVLTLAMGLSFGAAGGEAGGTNIASSTAPSSNSHYSPPRVIVMATGVSPLYLYQSSSYSRLPSYMLVPLNGLQVTLQSLEREGIPSRERAPPVTLITNSSGAAQGVVSPGNYSVFIGGPNFSVNTTLSFVINSTTKINLEVDPSASPVSTVHVVSPDSPTGIEPTTEISAMVGGESAPGKGFAELVGYGVISLPGGVSLVFANPLVVNATVVGSYQSTQGYWAVLSPSSSYPTYPTSGLMLFRFKPVLVVSTSVG